MGLKRFATGNWLFLLHVLHFSPQILSGDYHKIVNRVHLVKVPNNNFVIAIVNWKKIFDLKWASYYTCDFVLSAFYDLRQM